MDLSKIMSISGKPGLYKMVSQSKSGLVVESLIDGKKIPVFASDRVSSLQEISMFATDGDVPLKEVLLKVFKFTDHQPAIDPKSDTKALMQFMDQVMPDWDRDRIYASDIKKLLTWYNLLLSKELIDDHEEPVNDELPVEEKNEEA